jgi:hypothetical protein
MLNPKVTSIHLSGSSLHFEIDGVTRQFSRAVLNLLAFYQQPHTLEEGLQFLGRSATGMQGLARAFTRLIQLCQQDVLVAEQGGRSGLSKPQLRGYGPRAQIRMLEDRVRTSSFIRAIRLTVKPDDVVLDLGTGSGVLAVAAAQAGAKRVYAIEARPIADVAEHFFQRSGFGDRITLIRGMSTEITLPERADLLVSELIGEDPLAEQILGTTNDAIARSLKPEARLIPSTLRVYATPVAVPPKFREKIFFTPEVLDRWQRWYGLPFRALLDQGSLDTAPITLVRAFVDPWNARNWSRLGESALLHNFHLAAKTLPAICSEATVSLNGEGELGGFLIHFEAELAQAVGITTKADCVNRRNHWMVPLWLLPSPVKLHTIKSLRIRSGFQDWSSTLELRMDPA